MKPGAARVTNERGSTRTRKPATAAEVLHERGANRSHHEPALTTIAGDIFVRWRDALTRAFVADGFDAVDAGSLAVTCIASLDGAAVLCRSTGCSRCRRRSSS